MYIVPVMNIHEFRKLIVEYKDTMTEEEFDILTDRWIEEFQLYALGEKKEFSKSKI